MPVIRLETFMRAPVEACFDAARNIDLHAAAGGVLPLRGADSSRQHGPVSEAARLAPDMLSEKR